MLGRWTHRPASCNSLLRTSLQECRHTSHHVRISRGDDLGPTRDDAHQTFRIREHGDGQALPLPPLLDPVVREKRSQWDKKKLWPNAETFTPFQKKLQANPFAHALASPVRQCRATLISLPVAFLTSLHARPHPTTLDPWLLPVSLTTEKKQLGPPYRFALRHLITTQLGKKKAWEKGIYSRMEAKYGSSNVKNMVWREDLPDLILDLMQKQLIKKISWNLGFRGRLAPVASPRSEDIEHVDDVSCILFFGSLRTRADDVHDHASEIVLEMDKWSSYVAKAFADKLDPHAAPEVTHSSPSWFVEPIVPRLQPRLRCPELEFKNTTWRGQKVPVYSLADLLGENRARQLITDSEYKGEKCVVMKTVRHNLIVQILLMRLQAYIAQPGP
ncbi:hypothetical protein CC86DRAFT_208780 [Ophiobolus disseminans]|uniref:Uncharacterized protein n=1 Tax=Ophiobolus disseminans TaxID=1469910 RepID=A0A6A7A3C8_9PLEO|nr:hypothetical protein CC86DRAFT_208780 [Ophiobolus disseminans]